MKTLIALLVIVAGVIAPDQAEIQPGATFDAPDDIADTLIADGRAKLAEPEQDKPKAPATPRKPVQGRLLHDSYLGKVNDIVTLSVGDMKAAKASGFVDDDADAVAYAKTLAKPA